MSERLACKAVGLARSTYRNLPMALTPSDPDADMRVWLRSYATKHPCHGFRRAWAALRYDERREVNKKKIHRLWREEGLQVKVTLNRPEFDAHLLSREGCSHHAEEVRRGVQGPGGAVGR